MSGKWIKALKIILIIAIVLVAVHFILRIDTVDRRLTALLGSSVQTEQTDFRIHIDGFTDRLPEEEAPYVYEEDGRLWFLQTDGMPLEITPPDVNLAYYAKRNDVPEQMKQRNHCVVNAARTRMLFLLDLNEIPTLFLADLENGGATRVSGNVDTFLFLGEHVVYATGYVQANQLYAMRQEGPELLARNVESWVLESEKALLCLDGQGKLFFRDPEQDETVQLTDLVLEVYADSLDTDPDTLVYCKRKDGDYRVTASGAEKLSGSYGRVLKTEIGADVERKRVYYFSEADGQITCEENGTERRIAEGLGKVYAVCFFDARTQSAVAANQSGLYLVRLSAGAGSVAAVRLLEFRGDYALYRKNAVMVKNHLAVYSEDGEHFYVVSLTDGSFVLNRDRRESWMNRYSSYLYGVTHVYLKAGTEHPSDATRLDLIPTRTPQKPLFSNGLLVFTSVFADGSVRSVASVSGARVVCRDLLCTGSLARGGKTVRVEKIGEQIYFTTQEEDAPVRYSVMQPDGKAVDGLEKQAVSAFGVVQECPLAE